MSGKLFFLLLLTFALSLFSCEQQPVAAPDQSALEPEGCLRPAVPWGCTLTQGSLTVMTRNIYVGTDVDMVMAADSAEEVPLLATQAFQMLLSTDFAGRAELLANEIQKTRPDLIGLQEVYLFRVQSPGDLVFGGTEL
jgi:hypothetical protein